MPELPEVETTLRGVFPHLQGRQIKKVLVRNAALRYPVDNDLSKRLLGQMFMSGRRRGKYLLFGLDKGTLMIHLGMSGNLRLVSAATPVMTHDHVDIVLESGPVLRYNDPRRFGMVLWLEGNPADHELLRHLGPEPLEEDFDGDYLYRRSLGRSCAIKTFVMDSKIVVGVGNIYANEALYRAGINPLRAAGKISRIRFNRLATDIVDVLSEAIRQGGTTLRDFVGGDGKPGYFSQQLSVYGRGGLPCPGCKESLKEVRLGQRTTVYCPRCQR